MLTSEKIKKLKALSTEELNKRIEYSPYRTRGQAIGNNELVAKVFEILHQRKDPDIDCETAYCFEGCEEKNIFLNDNN